MTASSIQKDIINACGKETTKVIIVEISDECFSILSDESADISDKEELSICLHYGVLERFLGIVHVPNTTSLTIKNAIDSASNIRGSIGGLMKTLILNECSSAHYVHCFAHQLQLILVATFKKSDECRWLFDEVLPILLNFVGGSPKQKEFLREKKGSRTTR